MLWLVVMLSPIVSGISLRGTAGLGGPVVLNPLLSGGFYPNAGIAPNFLPGYYPRAYEGHVAGAGEYQSGRNDGTFRNYAQTARANGIVRDGGGLASRDSDRSSGNQMVATGRAGSMGYYNAAAAARYNQAGNAAAGAAKIYGISGQDGQYGIGDEGHQKSHETSGFHKSYHNIESGKDTKFIDEDHNVGHQNHGQAHDAAYVDNGWDVRGKERGEDLYARRVADESSSQGAARVGGVHTAGYGSHDVNGYHHNEDLAHKRALELAEEQRLAKNGLQGMRANNGAIYHNELW